MDQTGGGELSFTSDIAAADEHGRTEELPVGVEDLHRTAGPIAALLGRLSIGGECVSGLLAASQAHAKELLNRVRHGSIDAPNGTPALQALEQVEANVSRAFRKSGELARNAPRAIVDYAAIGAMAILALMGATDWDTQRDRIERQTPSGQLPYQRPTSQHWVRPRSALTLDVYQVRGGGTQPPEWVERLFLQQEPAQTLPASRRVVPHEKAAAAAPIVTQQQADLATRYLTEFLSAGPSPWDVPVPSFAAMAQRTNKTANLPAPQDHRRIRVRVGSMTMAFSGPTQDIYGRIGAWRTMHPDAEIISDEPLFV